MAHRLPLFLSILIALTTGCTFGPPESPPDIAAPADLAVAIDAFALADSTAAATDATAPADLSVLPDGSAPFDFAPLPLDATADSTPWADLAPVLDFATPPDLAEPDITAPCGGYGQACCAGLKCTGANQCIVNGPCGAPEPQGCIPPGNCGGPGAVSCGKMGQSGGGYCIAGCSIQGASKCYACP